jgi:hypothetical protein
VHRRLLGWIEGEVSALHVTRDEPRALERAANPGGDSLHQLLELPGARGRHRNEYETAFPRAAINAIEHEQVKVHVEIQRTAEARCGCSRAAVS